VLSLAHGGVEAGASVSVEAGVSARDVAVVESEGDQVKKAIAKPEDPALLSQLSALDAAKELSDYVAGLKESNATLLDKVVELKAEVSRLEERRKDERQAQEWVRKMAMGMNRMAEKVAVINGKSVAFPLFEDVNGGPLFFHYDCRCAAEAELLARSVRDRMSSLWLKVSR